MSMGGSHGKAIVHPGALNHFNYATIISLFDVISIIKGIRVEIRDPRRGGLARLPQLHEKDLPP